MKNLLKWAATPLSYAKQTEMAGKISSQTTVPVDPNVKSAAQDICALLARKTLTGLLRHNLHVCLEVNVVGNSRNDFQESKHA